MAIQIVKETLEQQVEAGWKAQKLAEHYGLPMTQMRAALKQCGLKIRKFHQPKFEIITNVELEEDTSIAVVDPPEVGFPVTPEEETPVEVEEVSVEIQELLPDSSEQAEATEESKQLGATWN